MLSVAVLVSTPPTYFIYLKTYENIEFPVDDSEASQKQETVMLLKYGAVTPELVMRALVDELPHYLGVTLDKGHSTYDNEQQEAWYVKGQNLTILVDTGNGYAAAPELDFYQLEDTLTLSPNWKDGRSLCLLFKSSNEDIRLAFTVNQWSDIPIVADIVRQVCDLHWSNT